MKRYRIEWIDLVARTAYVTAESESAARQCWIEGDFDYEDPEHVETGTTPTYEVVEES